MISKVRMDMIFKLAMKITNQCCPDDDYYDECEEADYI